MDGVMELIIVIWIFLGWPSLLTLKNKTNRERVFLVLDDYGHIFYLVIGAILTFIYVRWMG